MEFWFSELHTGNVKLSIKIEKQLFSGESEYQRIDVFDSEEFGKFISLDGEIVSRTSSALLVLWMISSVSTKKIAQDCSLASTFLQRLLCPRRKRSTPRRSLFRWKRLQEESVRSS